MKLRQLILPQVKGNTKLRHSTDAFLVSVPILILQQANNNNPQYQLNGKLLRSVSHQRGLGVIVDETLKPNRQCAKAAKNANSIMRAIKASFIDITPALFHKLYGAFIRPHLEYSFQAWRPWLKKDIKLLEHV